MSVNELANVFLYDKYIIVWQIRTCAVTMSAQNIIRGYYNNILENSFTKYLILIYY